MRALLAIPSTHCAHLWSSNSNSHTRCLRLHSSEWLRASSAFASIVIFETLGCTPGKLHCLITLGGCRLLDGSNVVSVDLSAQIVEKSQCWLWGVRAHLAGAAKVTLVESRYWVSSYPLGSKIKSCLDRGSSESLNSTSTWIRVDQQITDTTRKISVSFSSLFTYYFASS